MLFDLAWIKTVVAHYCPEFRMHPSDVYMPCSAEFFLEHSELRYKTRDREVRVLLPRGTVDGQGLLREQNAAAQRSAQKLWLELDPCARTGEPVDGMGTSPPPVYAHVKVLHPKGNPSACEALEINYITLYPYNGEYTVAGLFQTGHHDGDIEHLTVRVDHRTGALQGVWFNAHRSRDGEWRSPEHIVRSGDGRIVAWVALHGHGTYPKPGIVQRHCWLGNDRCADGGPVWQPRRVVLLPNDRSPRADASFRAQGSTVIEDVTDTDDTAAAQLWRAALCISRGSTLPVPSIKIDRLDWTNAQATDARGRIASRMPLAFVPRAEAPEVITDDPCNWLFFTGDWGTTRAAIKQSWFHAAETPVSRSSALRIFGHFWPETMSIH